MPRDEKAIESEIQAKGLNAPRLTPAMIDDQIVAERYVRGSDIAATGGPSDAELAPSDEIARALSCLTICVLVLKNGFTVTGKSACASPENYNEELGRKIAFDDARNQIWALEGYYLRHKLAGTQYQGERTSPS